MYRIFVGNKPIVLTDQVALEDGFKNYLLSTVNIGHVIQQLNKTSLKEVRLIHSKKDKLLKKFLKTLPNVIAGGGKVYNNRGEVLFIYRNNKWDLPKGKAEPNESIEETAMREVTEETGVNALKIIKPLETTYHIFKRNGRHKIKVTHWFAMKTTFSGSMKAQENEGITDVQWLAPAQIDNAMKNAYANIKTLVS